MKPLLKQIQHTPLLWMLIFVPVVLVAEAVVPHSHTLLFALSVLAIVPLAALLSHATEAVAAKTGDTVGGLLNATLGNLTELVIAITALRVALKRSGRPIRANDAWIAALALEHRLPLLSRDVHFDGVPDLERRSW